MDRKMKEVEALLELDSKDGVFEIGIWGVGGSGKTSLARCVSEQISSQFQDYCYYLMNDTNSKNCSSLTCLLEEITRAPLITSMSQSLVTTKDCDVVKARFRQRKVLLVVDGVDCIRQLKRIKLVARLFGPGSRVIVVTEEKNLLVECNVKHLYEVESLRYEEALQLFTHFAFKEKDIPADFDQLCFRAVLIAGCLPLALKVLGSLLCGRSIEVWEYEILRLEESRDKGFAEVSSYIKYPPKRNQYSGEGDRDKFPSYSFVFV